ncbi:MAG: hypothetical protein G01um101448_1138, partial [Parcubacteria group bacterium Gr01-1014_48]
ETVWNKVPNPYILSWSLWFHDYVYDIGSDWNEQRSAIESMRVATAAKLSGEFATTTCLLIVATKRHQVVEIPHIPRTYMEIFLDIDLSILGKPWKQYLEYCKNIREEYKNHFSWEIFSAGRADILENFLKREALFHYPPFRDLYERRARENLAREINILRTMNQEDAYAS